MKKKVIYDGFLEKKINDSKTEEQNFNYIST